MTSTAPFSCYLIGGDTLLARCGEVLLSRGHRIAGVVTSAPAIESWAVGHGLNVVPAGSDYASVLSAADFDYLFAITHLALIPDDAVASPAKLAVNFHDGPLPRYAGLNAPMWAILNGEKEYGISWHAMSADIDEGDILLTEPVAITEEDTALSLNTKCFAAALDSFPRLVDQLASGTVQRSPQNLAERTYFGRSARPPAAGFLDWQRPALELQRLVRGLNTGDYENSLGSAKVLLGDTGYIVEQAEVLAGSAVPGEVVRLDSESIVVGTGKELIAIQALRSLNGDQVPLEQVIKVLGLLPGTKLAQVDVDAVEAEQAACSSSEKFWAGQLGNAEAASIPFRTQSAKATMADERWRTSLSVPASFKARSDSETAIGAAFALFLGRLLSAETVGVAVAGGALKPRHAENACWVADFGFVQCAVDAEVPASDQLAVTIKALHKGMKAPWLRDLIAREPKLRTNPLFHRDTTMPVGIAFDGAQSETIEGSELLLEIGSDGSAAMSGSMAAYSEQAKEQLAELFQNFLTNLEAASNGKLRDISLISDEERERLIEGWNRTELDYPRDQSLHSAFEAQAARTPHAVAVADAAGEISYAELDQRAAQVAASLLAAGVERETLVGVHVPRSIDLVVAALGVLKAGAAYVPLDPAFPADRIDFMISDSEMPLILSHSAIAQELPSTAAKVLVVDELPAAAPSASTAATVSPDQLAYVIYTSGSTGRPKGVMIEHRNVVNFFAGMDERVPQDENGEKVWLAVTSLSFDISVLELFWTLTRGFKVVIYDEALARGKSLNNGPRMTRPLDMGLFMWGNDDAPGAAKYRLLLEGAKYFDDNGYAAVWTPERHFHAFGGPYPNPAVTGAAVAAITRNVKIRAGSCVVPLHHPVRIAEEWAVVDNLSDGRVEIAAASGWNPNDFVLKPENHADNKNVMYKQLEQVRALWRGEKIAFTGPLGNDVEVQSLPRPVQTELPCWITTAGNPETWRQAGELGLNVLTHLLGQSVNEVAEKIRIYRKARSDAGFDPAGGRVALMLHTFVGEDNESVKELVREPMKSYLSSSMKLAMDYAWNFPAFQRPGGADSKPEDVNLKALSDEETDTILDFAFERYFETSGLFGDKQTCVEMLARCSEAGVDEIACLLDFGVDTDLVMDSLPRLTAVRDRANAMLLEEATPDTPYSFASQVLKHGVTHMQCTPSSARMFMAEDQSRAALARIPHLLLGGEALPLALASELKSLRHGSLTNMYGPTETTIWSLTQPLDELESGIAIGRPIANTQVYVLNKYRHPVPVGVPGELFIAGDGVARGYLKRPDLTNERFVADPFRDGATMYATGDLACYRPDGVLDFLGRNDFQVKVRGYRIELGEIEHRLESLDSVKEAAAVVRADSDADQRLVAYAVASKSDFDEAQLREALKSLLPDYMVPNEIIQLPEMPRTANGKLDRKALLSFKPNLSKRNVEDAAPLNDTEKLVTELWKQTLKLEEVGRNENFFDLGGHSLLVVQLHGQIKQALERPVSLTDLYQYPTVSSFAAFLVEGGSSQGVKKASSRGERRRAMRQRRAS